MLSRHTDISLYLLKLYMKIKLNLNKFEIRRCIRTFFPLQRGLPLVKHQTYQIQVMKMYSPLCSKYAKLQSSVRPIWLIYFEKNAVIFAFNNGINKPFWFFANILSPFLVSPICFSLRMSRSLFYIIFLTCLRSKSHLILP